MRIEKILVTMTLIVIVTAVVSWFRYMKAPNPEDVCRHLQTLAIQDVEDVVDDRVFDKGRCVRRLQPPEFGVMSYVQRMKCMHEAGTYRDAMICRARVDSPRFTAAVAQ